MQIVKSVQNGVKDLTYCASMRLFTRMPPHVNDQHVLSLEGLFLPRAAPPLTHERLLVGPDVILVQVLETEICDKKIS